ncbi:MULTISPECIES: DUF6328 family protein [unclassified Leifsonia]|uniref:DUF6328 family protein n=1 Tax=unclassified Leifsonia TaxID=2663824 RepID=UPI0006FB731D|nr:MULTISPECIES: DUF6328 family protein [unclassified Leifsonia]KQX07613.1 sodium:proton antiporter [Leifsonia sp. Root1293]KRA11895.1 sodium:proton antiporter [Leifsonia sp. Root60]
MADPITTDVQPHDGRDETATERSDRNWNELLQEFRVLQTGTQILAGFLLTLPFQSRFDELSSFDVGVYLTLVVGAVLLTMLALTPVSIHRLLFRRHAKPVLVNAGNRILLACLAASSLLFAGIVLFLFDFLLAAPAGWIAGGVVIVVALGLWVALPLSLRRHGGADGGAGA